jgi:hypothetical protein
VLGLLELDGTLQARLEPEMLINREVVTQILVAKYENN